MKPREIIHAVTTAYRERDAAGRIQEHPGWHDLDPAEKREAFEATLVVRRLEAALHPEGLSSTAAAVLQRIRG